MSRVPSPAAVAAWFGFGWLSLVGLTIAMVCGLVFGIRVEERALREDLGDDYRNHAATHKRLVPFIW